MPLDSIAIYEDHDTALPILLRRFAADDWQNEAPDALEKSFFAALISEEAQDRGFEAAERVALALVTLDTAKIDAALIEASAANAATAEADPTGFQYRAGILAWIEDAETSHRNAWGAGRRVLERFGPREAYWYEATATRARLNPLTGLPEPEPEGPKPPTNSRAPRPFAWMNEFIRTGRVPDAAPVRVNAAPVGLPQPPPKRRGQLPPLVFARDMAPRLTAGGTLIKGLLDEGAMSVIYAPSNVGKSFLTLNLAFHIATGRDWRGRKIKSPGAVLYLAAEGGYGFINRVVAIKRHHGLADDADIPLAVLPCPVDLLNPKADRETLVSLIDQVSGEFGQPVTFLALDTLSRLMAGGDENGPKDMTAFVDNVDYIRSARNVHCCVVHHAGKDVAKGARGHSSLRAATDTEIEIARTGEGNDKSFSVSVKKQREMPGDNVFSCALQSVHLGTDEDGDAVTSAVVVHLSGEAKLQAPAMPEGQRKAFDILEDMIAREGEPLPEGGGYPVGGRGVAMSHWQAECEARGLSDAKQEASRVKAFQRAWKALETSNHVATRAEWVWLSDPRMAWLAKSVADRSDKPDKSEMSEG